MKRSALTLAALAFALVCMGSACSSGGSSSGGTHSATTTTVKPRDAGEAIAYDSRLSTFATVLNASGVLGELSGTRNFTVFAPDNDAFANIQHAALVALLTEHKDGRLAKFVKAHVVKGAIAENALHNENVKTLDGQTLTIRKTAQGITVSDGHGHTAAVELPPINASNAVIYPVKNVLGSVAAGR
jgi:uncharacterized surface protein with fasciclin (FAS1) repeats